MEGKRTQAPKEETKTNDTAGKDDMTDPDNDEYNMDNKNVNDKPASINRYAHKKNDVLNSGHTNANLCEGDDEDRRPCIEEEISSTPPASSSTITKPIPLRCQSSFRNSTFIYGTESCRLRKDELIGIRFLKTHMYG